jgi:hypothetical protein
MRTLTDIEVQYVSGGNGKAPIPPAGPAPNDGTKGSWGDWVQDIGKDILAGAARMADAIAGFAEDVGQALVNVTDKGPESIKINFDGYSRTSCATGQELDGDKCTYPDKPKGD